MTAAADLVVVGTGDHARVVVEAARAGGHHVRRCVLVGHAPTPPMDPIDGLEVMGRLEDGLEWMRGEPVRFVAALGDNRLRARAFQQCVDAGWSPEAVVHPSAIVLTGATIGPGSQVAAGAVVGLSARVSANVILNTASSVDHDCVLEDHAFVAPGAHLAGRVRVGKGAFVGIGVAVREGVDIGAWSVIGAGAAVVRDIEPSTRVAGVPAVSMEKVGAHGE